MAEPVSWTWMSDDPLSDPSGDSRSKYFGRETFVKSMSDVMRRAREQSPSSAFGLIGPWGSGKSTILASLRTDLLSGRNNSLPWQVREFNPWIFPDTLALQFGFFAELRQALPEDKQWSDTRQMLSTLRNVVSPMAKAGALFGIDGSPLVDALFDENRVSALQMREKVALHLEKLQSPILFVLDDLDRLTAAELLEVFKLVRFTGRLPNVYYLLCYDEKTLVDMLDKTDLVGAINDRRSLEYLEKIVQIRFDVPPLREDLVQELFELATEALLQKESIVPSQAERNRLRHVFESGFSARLHTPRAVKHLMAQLEAFLPTVGIEVDWVDFVLLSWVRTFEPELYAHLQLEKSFLLGAGRAYEFDKKAAAAKSAEYLEKFLERVHVTETRKQSTLAVLMALFPAVRRAREGTYYSPTVTDGRRIATADYFDRYFQFGVPPDDLPDKTVREAIADMPEGNSSSLKRVSTELVAEPARTIRKLRAERATNDEEALRLSTWLISQYNELPEYSGGHGPRDQIEYFLPSVLVDAAAPDALDLANASLAVNLDTVELIAEVGHHLRSFDTGGRSDIERWNRLGELLGRAISPQIAGVLDAFTTGLGVFDLPQSFWRVLYLWEFLNPGHPKSYLTDRRKTDGWAPLDILARLVTTTVPVGSREAIGTVDSFDPTWAGQFIDIGSAARDLEAQISAAGSLSQRHELQATPDNRRSFVLAWLKAHPDDR